MHSGMALNYFVKPPKSQIAKITVFFRKNKIRKINQNPKKSKKKSAKKTTKETAILEMLDRVETEQEEAMRQVSLSKAALANLHESLRSNVSVVQKNLEKLRKMGG
jgi:hypothetical protein